MDDRDCDLVESVPGRMSGVPVIKGTRVPVEAIEIGMDLGQTPEQLAYDYRINENDVRELFAYLLKAESVTGPRH